MLVKKTLDIVIPVLNEEKILADTVQELVAYASENLSEYNWRILIADNGSTDTTNTICLTLSKQEPKVSFTRLEKRGRGRALKQAWINSDADIVSYMDVDLSTDLTALPSLINAIENENFDIAIASRLSNRSKVIGRSPLRTIISWGYSAIVQAIFMLHIRDYQCGFKAISQQAANDLIPLILDTGWFFDTELIVIAAKNGYRIREIPVKWVDSPDSRVKIISTAYRDIKGLLRLRFHGLSRASKLLSNSSKST